MSLQQGVEFLLRLEWGDVAGWAQAIGNVAVLAVAVSTLRRDSRRIAALEAREAEERREYAADRVAGVAAWPETWGSNCVTIKAVNNTVSPVYDVAVRVLWDAEASPTFDSQSPAVKRALVIAPGEDLDATVSIPGPEHGDAPFVEIRFRDTSGRTWTRDYQGVLRLLGLNEND